MSKEQIEGEFRKYGVLEDFKVARERNCAFVEYANIEDAVNALEALNRTRIGGVELRVDCGRSQPSKRVRYLPIRHVKLDVCDIVN